MHEVASVSEVAYIMRWLMSGLWMVNEWLMNGYSNEWLMDG